MQKEKQVKWVGTSLKDLRAMPVEVKLEVGFVLHRVQEGKHHASLKRLSGLPGVWEIRTRNDGDAYRVVYVVDLPDAIYVLHAFKKKSRKGISTPQYELEVVHQRLKIAKGMHREEQTGRKNL